MHYALYDKIPPMASTNLPIYTSYNINIPQYIYIYIYRYIYIYIYIRYIYIYGELRQHISTQIMNCIKFLIIVYITSGPCGKRMSQQINVKYFIKENGYLKQPTLSCSFRRLSF